MDFSNRLPWRVGSEYVEHLGLHFKDTDGKQVWCIQLVDKKSGIAYADLTLRGGIVERFASAEACREEASLWRDNVLANYRQHGYLFFVQIYGHMERVNVINRYAYGAYDVERVADRRFFRASGFECVSDLHPE